VSGRVVSGHLALRATVWRLGVGVGFVLCAHVDDSLLPLLCGGVCACVCVCLCVVLAGLLVIPCGCFVFGWVLSAFFNNISMCVCGGGGEATLAVRLF
jgi:hypothetical protein